MTRFPRLAPQVSLAEDPDGRPLVVQEQEGPLLRIGRLEALVLSQLDGRTPLIELEQGLALVTGRVVPRGTVRRLVERLAELKLVEIPVPLPIHWLPDDRTQCIGSGDCCHLQVGPLEPFEADRLASLPWEAAQESPPPDALLPADRARFTMQRTEEENSPEQSEELFVRRQPDGGCAFLEADGRCQLHRVFGGSVKPAICRVYPLFSVQVGPEIRVGSSILCPGVGQASAGQSLDEEIGRLGDLLLQTSLEVGPLTLFGPQPPGQRGRGGRSGEVGDEVEEELLELLGRAGASVEEALALALRRVLELAGAELVEGVTELTWQRALQDHFRQLAAEVTLPRDRERITRLTELLGAAEAWERQLAEGGVRLHRLAPELDGLYRRNLRVLLFTRYHLFRFGLVAGMALAARLHLLARGEAERRVAQAGDELRLGLEQGGPPLREAFLGAQGLSEIEEFPGVGRRILIELAERLERIAVVSRGGGPEVMGAGPG